MKRIAFVALALILVLAAAPTAQAQMYAGVRAGVPFGASLHVGFGSDPVVRLSGMVRAHRDEARLGAGVDLLWPFLVQGPTRGYVGGGAALIAGSGVLTLDGHGLIGGEFRLQDAGVPQLGLFLEGTAGARVAIRGGQGEARVPTVGVGLGVNWHF